MSHVFISYSKTDRTYARQLVDRLRMEGYNVWIDDRISYGEEWWAVIVKAIKECAAFIVIMSNESRASKWVKREVNVGDELNKPFFPLLLEGENWDLFFATQYVDVRDNQLPPDGFFDSLARVLPRQTEPGLDITQSMPPMPAPTKEAVSPKDAAPHREAASLREAAPPKQVPKPPVEDLGDLELPHEAPARAPVRASAPSNVPPPPAFSQPHQNAAFVMGQGGGGGGAVWAQPMAPARTFPLSLEQSRRIVGGIILLAAILMFFAFFSASWMDLDVAYGELSAWEIWQGKAEGEEFTLDFSDESEAGGFDQVRGMDRLLILMPLGAVVLGVLAVQYVFGRVPRITRISMLPRRRTAYILLGVALLLFLYPFLWESASSGNWRDAWSGYGDSSEIDAVVNQLEEAYSTGQQALYGFIALLAGIAAVALETPRARMRLGLPVDGQG